MIRRLALLWLCVIALMTTPGVRADWVPRGAQRLLSGEQSLAIQAVSSRQTLHPERQGGSPRQSTGKAALLGLLPPPPPRIALPQATLAHGLTPPLLWGVCSSAARARAPPSVA